MTPTRPTPLRLTACAAAASLALLLAACGGGSSSSSAPPDDPDPGPTPDARTAAAQQTAEENAECTELGDFYWEIGDKDGVLASGRVGDDFDANTMMPIASASKWIYAAYVAQVRGGSLDAQDDVRFLNFTSGYSNFDVPQCPEDGSVSDCLAFGDRDEVDATEADQAQFHYNSGHMQVHASNIGLGGLANEGLADTIADELGGGIELSFFEPHLAGGAVTNASNYAKFLRGLLSGGALELGPLLGSNAVCTLPSECTSAVASPSAEDWHYSLGHWVEDDADTTPAGDGAFSSAGALGFYPWVSADRTHYGILARRVEVTLSNIDNQEGFQSAQCGRLVRRAWDTAEPQ